MSVFLYFAYGSNMLTSRLRQRCPSARVAGTAWAGGYVIQFWKEGRDGSGKASLLPQAGDRFRVQGVLYQIDLSERPSLDRAEARYDRHDEFMLLLGQSGAPVTASTYIAQPNACRNELVPFDWYVALMIAGAREHGLEKDYIARLLSVETCIDSDAERTACMTRLAMRP